MGHGSGPSTRLRLIMRDGSRSAMTTSGRTATVLGLAMSATEKAGGRREGRQEYERMHRIVPFMRSEIMVNAEWLRIGSRGLRKVPDDSFSPRARCQARRRDPRPSQTQVAARRHPTRPLGPAAATKTETL